MALSKTKPQKYPQIAGRILIYDLIEALIIRIRVNCTCLRMDYIYISMRVRETVGYWAILHSTCQMPSEVFTRETICTLRTEALSPTRKSLYFSLEQEKRYVVIDYNHHLAYIQEVSSQTLTPNRREICLAIPIRYSYRQNVLHGTTSFSGTNLSHIGYPGHWCRISGLVLLR